ncbi:hypothetical protein [Yinghuangia sp. YIM S09857]|uniref:hypothetical protein n=1 Tax=Yinghuangia sp. YIM S09857 TaxID=3436929 RepID=UPI003F534CE4
MARRGLKDLGGIGQAGIVLVLCLAGVALGLVVWGDDDGGSSGSASASSTPSPGAPDGSSPGSPGSPVPDPDPTVTKGLELPIEVTAPQPGYFNGDDAKLAAALPPAPDIEASLTDKVLHELQEKTLRLAGVPGRISASCPKGPIPNKAGGNAGCTVVYEGVEVNWAVVIEGVGYAFTSYRTYLPETGVLVDAGVYGAFWEMYHDKSDKLRCDVIPHLTTAKLDRYSGFECQYLDTRRSPARWVNVPVILGHFGVQFS